MRWRQENAILYAAARGVPVALSKTASADPLDWEYLLRAADSHGLLPLLHQWIQSQPDIAVPPEISAQVSGAYWANHFRNRIFLEELARVFQNAAAAGIAVMPLKGAALALLYYPTPALRPMSDLDLLVRPGDVGAMTGLLHRLGYKEVFGGIVLLDERFFDAQRGERRFVANKDGCDVLIELRIEPLDPLIDMLSALDPVLDAALHDRAAWMWTRGQDATHARAPFARLSPEDLLLHVASHLTTRHRYFRLLWLYDLSLIITAHGNDIDWAYVGDAARRLRLSVPVHAALAAARQLLGAPVPLAEMEKILFAGGERWRPLQRLGRAFFARRIRAASRGDLTAQSYAQVWLVAASFGRLRGWKPRLRALRWIIFPSRAYLAAWQNELLPASRAAYAATSLRFIGISLLRALGGIGRFARVPVLPALIDRFMERLHPFAAP
ncbi:MAG: nucleotidyltransferase family protein [Chloroflexota bacterium]|nr:nucleotidyltransferase family protein [Chloroflexota bacterium]